MAFIDEVDSFEAKARLRKAAPLAAAGIAALVLAIAFFALQGVFSGGGDFAIEHTDDAGLSVSSSVPSGSAAGANPSSDSHASGSSEVCVYVTGAVKHPGVYRFPASARVEDAVKAAGGFASKADRASLNLARVLADGEQIDVARKGSEQSGGSTQASPRSSSTAVRAGSAATASSGKVNINTAMAEELKTLDGIGDATAQKIIDYRTANGPFQRIEDIKNVSGIAEKRFEAIADRICV